MHDRKLEITRSQNYETWQTHAYFNHKNAEFEQDKRYYVFKSKEHYYEETRKEFRRCQGWEYKHFRSFSYKYQDLEVLPSFELYAHIIPDPQYWEVCFTAETIITDSEA